MFELRTFDYKLCIVGGVDLDIILHDRIVTPTLTPTLTVTTTPQVSTPAPTKHTNNGITAIVGFSVGGTALVAIVAVLLWCRSNINKKKRTTLTLSAPTYLQHRGGSEHQGLWSDQKPVSLAVRVEDVAVAPSRP